MTINMGFICGATAKSCYDGLIAKKLVVAGAQASTSQLVSTTSPLRGVGSPGTMPAGTGKAVTAAQLADIKSWLAAGAKND